MQTLITANPNIIRTSKIVPSRLRRPGLILIGLAALWFFRAPLAELLALARDRERLLDYMGGYGDLGMALMFILLFIQVIVAAVPGHLIMVAGGYLYGFVAAVLITHVSTVIASQVAYWLARRYGRPIVEKLAPAGVVETWTKRAEQQGVVFFMVAFLLPVFPADVMNFVAGLSGLSFRKFLTVNFIGRLPTSILFTLIGSYAFRISPGMLVAALLFTIVAFIVWRKLGSRFERN
jgi:uncharacterized membrane protein YdjX (TVP38/TMEM64 family)